MTPLEWSDTYLLQIPELDLQHQRLFSTMNDIIAVIREGIPGKALEDHFDRLLVQTRDHFRSEEKLMTLTGYPCLDQHVTSHHHLFDDVTKLMFRATNQHDSLQHTVVPMLKTWLTGHILTEDRHMAEHLVARLGEAPPRV